MLESGPSFAHAVRGYDRLQVDNYVAWAENELRVAQRLSTELVNRLAASEARAHRAGQLVAAAQQDGDLVLLADRVTAMLRVAAQEAAAAAEATGTDTAQARDVLAHAHEEAEVVIRRARRLEAAAAARLHEAERRLAEARTAEEQTRDRVQTLLQETAQEQERLEAETAARLAHHQRELAELQACGHQARQLLRQLTAQVDQALATLAADPPVGFSFQGNRADPPPPPPPAADRTVPVGRRHRLWRSS
jgi:cell division septum initiation protein DivIVA